MRKLKLQVQMSVDGFVGGPNGELDWMTWNWDDALKNFVNELTDSVDTILLGRKMTDGFVNHWTNIVKNRRDDESYPFAKKMVDKPKIVFTKTLDESNPISAEWENTRLAKGDIVEEVNKIKNEQSGKDIVVYGGAGFVSSLIKNNLIDEFYLFVNPAAIGNGLSIFEGRTNLKFVKSIPFSCGVVVLNYEPVK
jgi:dihydrofolate reductase